jgi:hypothetical protein
MLGGSLLLTAEALAVLLSFVALGRFLGIRAAAAAGSSEADPSR